jgi:hypothetical protein
MRWACQGLLLAALGAVGCQSMERQELEGERNRLEQSQGELRGYMSRNAPVGSAWASHSDTAGILEQMRRNASRIDEIDEELRRR